MSDRMPTVQALEQLREVIAILRELSNAGPRDQSFKQWRQVTLTLLQRIWPSDQANAARFRRIPFSPPSSRADARTVRECYERGVCEAIAYLESLVEELENGTSRLGRKLVRPAEAPLASAPEPARLPEPLSDLLPPGASFTVDPPPAPQASRAPEPQAPLAAAKPEPPYAGPERRAPARADVPPYGTPGRPERRSKPRLKDMLGFGDAPAPAAKAPASPAAHAPAPPASYAPASPASRAPAPPVESAPPRPIERSAPPIPPAAREQEVEYEFPVEPADEPAGEPADEPIGEDAPWSAPVIPLPGKVVVGRPSGSKPPAPPEDDLDEGAYDIDYDLAADAGPDVEPPPATLREMLDRAARPSRAAAPPAAREVLAMASAVDHLGVPPQRRTIVRAALIDLGHQMETPPVHWAAIRQAMAFMMDYPQIARRVIPMLLPYLDEAA